ncbi:MAG: UbiD family decarboxylase [Magnetococcales bacterium]|nr:UbiD family decarboxylase [Magnetococcales bacterium]
MTTSPKSFVDLRAFMAFLESCGQLARVAVEVDPHWEITEICRRLLAAGGPAVLFERVKGSTLPVLANLFGTQERVGLAIGRTLPELAELGTLLSQLKQPEPPRDLQTAGSLLARLSQVRHMPTRTMRHPPCQAVVWQGDQVDLRRLPIQTCWPGDAAPLVTWPLVITQGPQGGPINIGIYRMQVIGRNRLIMRWLKHRGGAQHAQAYRTRMPVAVAIGCDPGLLLAAVTPVPETLSEYAFAGLLREKRVETAPALTVPLPVPAHAEMILEGFVDLTDLAAEGPFGDHTGYYNEVESFPVFTVQCITLRRQPFYLSTYTGRPPDEPALLALALNHLFVPLLRQQFPEIERFHLPMEACSYRMAVVSLKKGYPGHAFRVMVGVWGFLRQFLYTKVIIVVDAGVDVTSWAAVLAAISQQVHARRDVQIMTNTPIDYLDFASPLAGLGGKMGIDATTKIGPEQLAAPPLAPLVADRSWVAPLCAQEPCIRGIYPLPGGRMAIAQVDGAVAGAGRLAIARIQAVAPVGAGADQLWVVDTDIDPASQADLLWAIATRADPGRDMVLERETGRFALDATVKSATGRVWGRVLRMEGEMVEQVTRRWAEYGLPGAGEPVP